MGEACGAVAGAFLVLGLKYGQTMKKTNILKVLDEIMSKHTGKTGFEYPEKISLIYWLHFFEASEYRPEIALMEILDEKETASPNRRDMPINNRWHVENAGDK